MATIVNKKQEKNDQIEVGDIFAVNDFYFRFIRIDEQFGLLEIESGTVSKTVDHVAHAINWVKKYHGEFIIIKNEDIEVTFK